MKTLERVRPDLNVALNEAAVVGLRPRPDNRVELLLHVLALPEQGPVDPDTRRALILSGVSEVRVLLRREYPGATRSDGPAIPLRDYGEVEDFFAAIGLCGTMYGWEFLDCTDPADDWPSVASLDIRTNATPGAHSLYWFNECGLDNEDSGYVPYCIEGVIEFAELTVERFDGTPMAVEDFVAAGKRWWRAMPEEDPRVSPDAQATQPPSPRWRSAGAPACGTRLISGGRAR
ncbi:hypothetical protein [Amycolatopsis aidingensis]|uniref:hypothetical protein n=1 Tax=Amycolatopsis aidingensis TaxID=2842453 RepID=UPI001C0C2C8C|nr:hypothetical protein [Amycolatopsis aidingensis]